MLFLIDIDGTLLDAQGLGLQCLTQAYSQHFGIPTADIPPLDLGGSTDLGLYVQLQAATPHARTEAPTDYFARYHQLLNKALTDHPPRLLPHVETWLQNRRAEGHTLALLTGNIQEAAWSKVQSVGLADYFIDGAYGSDHADRNALGPMALQRIAQETGQKFSPQDCIILGDTTKDIACAHALGAPCLAVCTGHHDQATLQAAQAPTDLILPDLSHYRPEHLKRLQK